MALTPNKIKRIRKAASQGLYVSDIDIMELCDLAVLGLNHSPEVERLVEAVESVIDSFHRQHPLTAEFLREALAAYKEAQR